MFEMSIVLWNVRDVCCYLWRAKYRTVIYLFTSPSQQCLVVAHWLAAFAVFSPSTLFFSPYILFSILGKTCIDLSWFPLLKSPPPPLLSLSHLQWRVSGWSGGRGQCAASLVTRGPSRGRGAAARRFMAGRSVKASIRRAGNAPTLPAVVRSTNEWKLGNPSVWFSVIRGLAVCGLGPGLYCEPFLTWAL